MGIWKCKKLGESDILRNRKCYSFSVYAYRSSNRLIEIIRKLLVGAYDVGKGVAIEAMEGVLDAKHNRGNNTLWGSRAAIEMRQLARRLLCRCHCRL